MDLSGIEAEGKVVCVPPGTVTADVVKVSIPVEDTLYEVEATPLKLKVKGTVWFDDQVGVDTEGPRIEVHPAARPFAVTSESVFNPPGFCPGEASFR